MCGLLATARDGRAILACFPFFSIPTTHTSPPAGYAHPPIHPDAPSLHSISTKPKTIQPAHKRRPAIGHFPPLSSHPLHRPRMESDCDVTGRFGPARPTPRRNAPTTLSSRDRSIDLSPISRIDRSAHTHTHTDTKPKPKSRSTGVGQGRTVRCGFGVGGCWAVGERQQQRPSLIAAAAAASTTPPAPGFCSLVQVKQERPTSNRASSVCRGDRCDAMRFGRPTYDLLAGAPIFRTRLRFYLGDVVGWSKRPAEAAKRCQQQPSAMQRRVPTRLGKCLSSLLPRWLGGTPRDQSNAWRVFPPLSFRPSKQPPHPISSSLPATVCPFM